MMISRHQGEGLGWTNEVTTANRYETTSNGFGVDLARNKILQVSSPTVQAWFESV